jgi:negative regulator of sigma E activity
MKTEPEHKSEFSPDDEARITRWIDGELDDDAVADLLSAHPELAAEKSRAHQLGDLLHSELAPEREKDVPYADFFSHRVRQRILEDDEEENVPASTSATLKDEATYLPLFTRLRYAAGMAFVVMLVGIVGYALFTPSSGSAFGSEVVSTYTPDPNVTATTRYDSEAGATIIDLEGLAEIPVDHSIAGVFPGSYQPCGDFGRTILTDPANGQPLLALAIDSSGRPEITALRF